MWISMKFQLIFITIWLSSYLRATRSLCPKANKTIDWNLRGNESSRPVNNFNLSLKKTVGSHKTPRLGLVADGLKIDLTIFLFALPGAVKNESLCPSDIGNETNLRRHKWVFCIPGNASSPENFDIEWNAIMTGCFYVVMRNEEGKYWQLEHDHFYETNYNYVNTKLEFVDMSTKPQLEKSSRELHPVIKVPLRCINLVTMLYELEGNISNGSVITKDRIYHKGKQEQQTCTIFYNGPNQTTPRFNCKKKNTNLTIETELIDKENDTWTVKIIWKNLLHGGNTYYTGFLRQPDMNAFNKINYRDSWASVGDPVILYKFHFDQDNSPSSMVRNQESDNIPLIIGASLCFLVGVLAIVMLGYWKFKCSRFVMNTENRESEESGNHQTFGSIFDGNESDQILIIYVKSLPLLMKAIQDLKDYLKRRCTYRIRDLYELNEWNDISNLGATEWVEQQLKAGSRVVWIDTPQFRSFLNDKQKKYTGDDFRDEALPHAVNLVKPLFQDATTQYRRHFVVRVKGFGVDDLQDDPLQTLTPYRRYYIPDHLPLLCEHLTNPPKPMGNTKNV